MLYFLCSLLFAEEITVITEVVSPVSEKDVQQIPSEIVELKKEIQSQPIGLQMRDITTPLLGAEYIVDAIGEEQEPDIDPIVRYDAFDCLTFVEEALALSFGETLEEAEQIRKKLRYGNAEISYENRNHFMMSQWLPNAVTQGYLVDITHEIGETYLVSKTVTTKTWASWRGRWKYPFEISQYPVGTYQFGVLSLDSAIDNIEKIPDGALVIILRQNKDYNPIWITHLGFVVRKTEKDIRIRHATKMSGGVVKDNYLSWYLDYIRYFDKWPVEGVLIYAPNEPQSTETETKE